jgi:DNA repair protein RecN (Recombination protein N)
MLSSLSIRDIVLIDRLDIPFAPGLSVLTGETGAGKSILLDSLALALGARGDAGLVRAGAAQGQVTAAFDVALSHPARALLAEAGIETGTDLVILRRVQTADGRTRGFVNDQAVSAQVMKAAGALLVEIHGQHDDRALVDGAVHRALLDAFGGLSTRVEEVRGFWRTARALAAERDAAEARLAAMRKEADWLRHAGKELAELAAERGEEERLAERRQAMMNVEKVAGDLKDAHDALDGGASPIPELSGLLRRVERKQAAMPAHLPAVVAALGSALDALEDARTGLEAALRAADFDPRELEKTEERLFALRAAARKYAVGVDALPALAAKYAADLESLDKGEGDLSALSARAAQARAAYDAAAAALSGARRATAARLDAAVMAELPPLKLERARFVTDISAGPAGPEGVDQVAFHVQTNPGTAAGPIIKVASGGELARFILALKVVLADAGSAPTLVFDEIDTGVGGAVAEAIGNRLARLAARAQVLCVTHAPQVAARAEGHFRIAKEAVGVDRVATRVHLLPETERREEIARMLSGATITDEARAQAGRLLAGGG